MTEEERTSMSRMTNMEELVIHAVRPWSSLNGAESLPGGARYDSQEKVNFCMEHCPYAECVNCLNGRNHGKMGRPPLIPDEDLERLKWMLTLKAADGEICREMGISQDLLRRCKRKIRREAK